MEEPEAMTPEGGFFAIMISILFLLGLLMVAAGMAMSLWKNRGK